MRPTLALFSGAKPIVPALYSRRAASSSSSSTTPPSVPTIPEPTPFCPDVSTFLTLIGRGMTTHASKFPTWESLFSLDSAQLRELGIEPPRSRRYLIQWRRRFQLGQFGVGGDLKHVQDGKADLRVLEHMDDAKPLEVRRFVVNVPNGQTVKTTAVDDLSRVTGYKVQGARTIVGPYALPTTGGEGATVTVTEGMWEDKRGRKVDGGERRRTMVRYKKRIEARRLEREQAAKA
jgi:hypothetical protein